MVIGDGDNASQWANRKSDLYRLTPDPFVIEDVLDLLEVSRWPGHLCIFGMGKASYFRVCICKRTGSYPCRWIKKSHKSAIVVKNSKTANVNANVKKHLTSLKRCVRMTWITGGGVLDSLTLEVSRWPGHLGDLRLDNLTLSEGNEMAQNQPV